MKILRKYISQDIIFAYYLKCMKNMTQFSAKDC